MKTTLILVTASAASAAVIRRQSQGNGPYGPVSYTTDDTLSRHTIYAPATGPDTPMPVLVWGNGACSDDGTSAQNFLSQLASYGFVAISSGKPGGSGGSTTADWMTEAVEWVVGGANGLNVDSSRIMAAGYSCGGTEAYQMQNNDAVSSIGIFNSGLLSDYDFAAQITKPIMFALGGPSDVAHVNGERDYAALPSDLPAWKGNLDSVGHGGTYSQPNGGLFAEAAANWMLWLYQGDTEAGAYFANSAGTAAGWSDTASQALDDLSTPVGDGNSTSASSSGSPSASGAANTTLAATNGERDCTVEYVTI